MTDEERKECAERLVNSIWQKAVSRIDALVEEYSIATKPTDVLVISVIATSWGMPAGQDKFVDILRKYYGALYEVPSSEKYALPITRSSRAVPVDDTVECKAMLVDYLVNRPTVPTDNPLLAEALDFTKWNADLHITPIGLRKRPAPSTGQTNQS